MSIQVFISFAKDDYDTAKTVVQNLVDHGFDICWQSEFDASRSMKLQAEEGIRASNAVVVLVGASTGSSGWVTTEINIARSAGIPVFPVVLPGASVADLPPVLQEQPAIFGNDIHDIVQKILVQLVACRDGKPVQDRPGSEIRTGDPQWSRVLHTRFMGVALITALLVGIGWMVALGVFGAIDSRIEKMRKSVENVAKGLTTGSSTASPWLVVEGITFGMPTVPAEYADKPLQAHEVADLLAGFEDDEVRIRLTEEEVASLNSIGNRSGMASTVSIDRSYSLKDVGKMLSSCIGFAYEYNRWPSISRSWSDLVRVDQSTGDARIAALRELVYSRIGAYPMSPGLLSGVVGMMANGVVAYSIPSEPEGQAVDFVDYDKTKGVLNVRKFRIPILDTEDPSSYRVKAAGDLATAFKYAMTNELGGLLAQASAVFENEAELMRSYVATWNKIIASRKPSRIKLRVTIVNPSETNSYVRTAAKVVVGAPGPSEESPISFLARAKSIEGGDHSNFMTDFDGPYFAVPKRSTLTVVFQTDLDASLLDRLYASYESGFTFLRLGLLVSSSASEVVMSTTRVAFSRKARENSQERVSQIALELGD